MGVVVFIESIRGGDNHYALTEAWGSWGTMVVKLSVHC